MRFRRCWQNGGGNRTRAEKGHLLVQRGERARTGSHQQGCPAAERESTNRRAGEPERGCQDARQDHHRHINHQEVRMYYKLLPLVTKRSSDRLFRFIKICTYVTLIKLILISMLRDCLWERPC